MPKSKLHVQSTVNVPLMVRVLSLKNGLRHPFFSQTTKLVIFKLQNFCIVSFPNRNACSIHKREKARSTVSLAGGGGARAVAGAGASWVVAVGSGE